MASMTTEMKLIDMERKNISFSVEELTNIIDGSREETAIRRRVEHIIENDPVLKHKSLLHMSREERFTESIRRTVYFLKTLCPRMGWTSQSREARYFERALKERSFVVHSGAFVPSMKSFGTKEQAEKWHKLAANLNIIGTYAQTELGHGTFLRGLETVATYDRATQEFVINCPRISAMKWWPGEMGKSANHVFLMAELVIDGKKYGMHGFMVQIRDLTTHEPLPGVTVGDIGTKVSFETVDNGFLYLRSVRVPRENLLSKLAQVAPDGTYTKKASDRLMYGSMVRLRVGLLGSEVVMPLSKACTIAVRYSAVRRQGLLDPNKDEVPVLNYVSQQHKLLPQVATAYVANFASKQLIKMYVIFLKKVDSGDIEQLPELHALSAGLKAMLTEQSTMGAEILRRACGGHGYSYGSGLPFIVNRMLASCTYEGENTVMYLQCARYLMKCADKARDKKLTGTVAYLNDSSSGVCPARTSDDFLSLNILMKCYENRAKCVIQQAASKLQQKIRSGLPMHNAWNMVAPFLIRAAKEHIMQYLVETSCKFVNDLTCSDPVKKILTQLCALYALHHINNSPGDFITNGCLNSAQCDIAHDTEVYLLGILRPDAVGIVDAFDFTDDILQSCLGAYDGNVYERLFEWAKEAPMNRTEVHQDSYQLLRPYLHKGRDVLEGAAKSKL
ncbi:peroxisomal acyl-coenzyme A oxidase 2-like [Clavelina lepadiformis]|uniref:peroxisomal acyl-coenzyme A oxidase 2-like n=1 Tax=Clavelina lepadiformis TaxID=159417 RepID=UPI004041325C